MSEETVKDKTLGMLVAHVTGDALGAPYEFIKEWKERIASFDGTIKTEPSYTTRYNKVIKGVVGQWTDDTEMTITLLDVLIQNKMVYDPILAIQGYLAWANSKPMGMGKNTRSLFYGVTTVKGYDKRFQKFSKETTPPESNGCLMRCSPFALLSEDTWEAALVEDVNLTNPCPNAREACIAYVKCLRLCFSFCNEKDRILRPKDIVERVCVQTTGLTYVVLQHVIYTGLYEKQQLDSFIGDKILRHTGHFTVHDYTNVQSRHKGWIFCSLYIALYCFVHKNNYQEAMEYIIRQGGDTDTNAAICGALFGAYYGFTKLVKDPVTLRNWFIVEHVNTDVEDARPRPARYHPSRYFAMSYEATFLNFHPCAE